MILFSEKSILCTFLLYLLGNEEINVNKGTDGTADFMFTLFIQQTKEVDLNHSPNADSSLSITMKQNQVPWIPDLYIKDGDKTYVYIDFSLSLELHLFQRNQTALHLYRMARKVPSLTQILDIFVHQKSQDSVKLICAYFTHQQPSNITLRFHPAPFWTSAILHKITTSTFNRIIKNVVI